MEEMVTAELSSLLTGYRIRLLRTAPVGLGLSGGGAHSTGAVTEVIVCGEVYFSEMTIADALDAYDGAENNEVEVAFETGSIRRTGNMPISLTDKADWVKVRITLCCLDEQEAEWMRASEGQMLEVWVYEGNELSDAESSYSQDSHEEEARGSQGTTAIGVMVNNTELPTGSTLGSTGTGDGSPPTFANVGSLDADSDGKWRQRVPGDGGMDAPDGRLRDAEISSSDLNGDSSVDTAVSSLTIIKIGDGTLDDLPLVPPDGVGVDDSGDSLPLKSGVRDNNVMQAESGLQSHSCPDRRGSQGRHRHSPSPPVLVTGCGVGPLLGIGEVNGIGGETLNTNTDLNVTSTMRNRSGFEDTAGSAGTVGPADNSRETSHTTTCQLGAGVPDKTLPLALEGVGGVGVGIADLEDAVEQIKIYGATGSPVSHVDGTGSNGLLVAPNQVNRTEELTRIRQQQGWANCVIQFVDDVASARGVTLEQLGLGSETQEWLRANRDTGNWVEGEYVGRLVQELGFSGIEEWSWPVPIDTTELICTEVEQQVSPCSGYKNTIEDDHLVAPASTMDGIQR